MRLTRHKTGLSHPVQYFYLPFQGGTSLWIICVIYVLCFSCFCVFSLLAYGHLKGKALVCDVNYDFVNFSFVILGQVLKTYLYMILLGSDALAVVRLTGV